MTVKEVVALAAANLGDSALAAEIEALSGEPTGEVSSLVRCYNLVENEVALDYFPLRREETLKIKGGKLAYTAFANPPVDILRVTDKYGSSLAFRAYPDYLALPDTSDMVVVKYAYAPSNKKISDESTFSGRVSARLLAYGVCMEYCLSQEKFEEALMWESRYRAALRAADVTRRPLKVRARRWA